MRFEVLVLFLLAGLVFLGGCLPVPTSLPPLPTGTLPLPSHTSTPTYVWFPPPPTDTPLPGATQPISPTLTVQLPGGNILFTDDFSDPSLWSLGRSAAGNASIIQNELSLVVTLPNGYLYSVRKGPLLTDFNAQITVSPTICRGEDQYGLLLRVTSNFDFYRYAITCDGRIRLDKYYQGVASSPQPQIYGLSVPPGAPSRSQLAVEARGKELKFYANGAYQFTVRDPSLLEGSIGVFAHAATEDAVTVLFSDLTVSKP